MDSSTSSNKGCLGCFDWLTRKLKLIEDGGTPPNWKYIGLVFMALFSSSVTLTFLFPFLPEMMLTLGYSENEKGTYAGMVASSFFGGRVVGSVFWGWLADRHGRKLVLLITIVLNGLFAGLFGLSNNLILAMFFRFMCGVVNGTVGTAKAILYDISDNSNQALGMSMVSISWGMGMIISPTLGGILASPALKWPHVFSPDGFFGQFPYILPSLFPFVCCILIAVLIFFKFDETLVAKSSKRTQQELIVDEPEQKKVKDESADGDTYLPLLGNGMKSSKNSLSRLGQSIQSLHLESESAAYLALKTTQEDVKTVKNSQPHKSLSLTDIVVEPYAERNGALPALGRSRKFHSTTSIYRPQDKKSFDCVGKKKAGKIPKSGSDCVSGNNFVSVGLSKKMGGEFDEVGDKKSTNGDMTFVKDNGQLLCGDHDMSKKGQTDVSERTTEEDNLLGDLQGIEKSSESYQVPEMEGPVCGFVESCCKLRCCSPCRDWSLLKLLRLSDVWATVMLYSIFSFSCIALEDVFPVFAATRVDYGGLGFSTDEIGLALGAIFVPLLVLQIKLYPFLVSKLGIRKVYMFSALISMVAAQCLPMVRVLNNSPVWLWVCLFGVQVPFKIAVNCCFAGSSLLINNSVTAELAGQVNGLAMMTTAIGRTLAPTVAGSFFSWTVTYGPAIGTPFDTSFPFFVLGAVFIITVFECLYLNPALDKQKK